MTSFRLQNGYQNEPQNGTRNWTPQKAAFLRKKNPVFQKGDQNGTPKGGTLWSARLFYVASLFFARFLGLPSLLWTIICPHFRALGLDFLVFSRLRFQDFGANETHPIHTHKPTIFIFHKGCPLRAGGDARSVRNFIMVLHDFSWRSSKIILFSPKTLIFFDQKSIKY